MRLYTAFTFMHTYMQSTHIYTQHMYTCRHTLRVTHTHTHTHTLKWGGRIKNNNILLTAHKIILPYHQLKKKIAECSINLIPLIIT